jgi:hypothetical protein
VVTAPTQVEARAIAARRIPNDRIETLPLSFLKVRFLRSYQEKLSLCAHSARELNA